MVIAFYEIAEEWERERLRDQLATHTLVFESRPLVPETAGPARDAEAVSVFIRSRVDQAVLDRLPRLRFVATRSTGFDHIDLAACRERGIQVSNVPHYGENTVAEHTFGLILALSRRILEANRRTRAGEFTLEGLEGMDLRGKLLGVIGAGSIGLHVIRIARAFGMHVVAYDIAPQPLIAEVLGFRYVSLIDLLGAVEVLTLHAPLTPETHHLMNRERFAALRRGALFVNTARGALVDTEALLWALDEDIVAGAALDVLEGEEQLAEEQSMFRTAESESRMRQLVAGSRLLERDDVIVTPHIAWFSREARQRILATTVENLQAFILGRPQNRLAA